MCEPEAREASEFSTCAFKQRALLYKNIADDCERSSPLLIYVYTSRGKFVLASFLFCIEIFFNEVLLNNHIYNVCKKFWN